MVLLKALVVNLPTSQQNDEEEKEKYQLQLDLGTYTQRDNLFLPMQESNN
jgi:hypothetical protein